MYHQLNSQLKSLEFDTYFFPDKQEIESLLIEIPNVPNELGIVSVSFNEAFKDYYLVICNLHFLDLTNYQLNLVWLDIINQLNISLPFAGLYAHPDGISYQYKFPAGSTQFDTVSFHMVCTIQMIVHQMEKVYDLIYNKLKNVDMQETESNKTIIQQLLIEFEESWFSKS